MKHLITALFIVTVFASCDSESGSGHIITKTRNTGDFKKLSVSEGIDVELTTGAISVKIEADDNLIDLVETDVEGGTLKIGFRDNVNINDSHIKVFVSAPEISSIAASSAGSVDGKGKLVFSGTMNLSASSSGSINVVVDAPGVQADASSAGSISVSGRTKKFEATSSSGSSINAFELLSEVTNAEASSGAHVDAFASISIDGTASSGGNVTYRGEAPTVEKHESSGGSVNKEN